MCLRWENKRKIKKRGTNDALTSALKQKHQRLNIINTSVRNLTRSGKTAYHVGRVTSRSKEWCHSWWHLICRSQDTVNYSVSEIQHELQCVWEMQHQRTQSESTGNVDCLQREGRTSVCLECHLKRLDLRKKNSQFAETTFHSQTSV